LGNLEELEGTWGKLRKPVGSLKNLGEDLGENLEEL